LSASLSVGELVCRRVGLSASWSVGELVVGELVCRRVVHKAPSHPASHVAVAITLNALAKASSLKITVSSMKTKRHKIRWE